MIAQWIARAMLRGEDHLILYKAELAEWQANGCRVSLGAPYGLYGPFAERQVAKWRSALVKRLIDTESNRWPVGVVELSAGGNATTAAMPALDFEDTGGGMWRVPLIPADPAHCLDAWAFDINLSGEELEAIKPIAARLVERMTIRCEIKSREDAAGRTVLWNKGRIALARAAGLSAEDLAAGHVPPYGDIAEGVEEYARKMGWRDEAPNESGAMPPAKLD